MSLRETLVPDLFDRDRPFHWNLFGTVLSDSRWNEGEEWRHFADEDGSLTCEECGYPGDGKAVMIVNDPFDPETPVDFDSPVQVLCEDCVQHELPIDSPYRPENKGGGDPVEIDPEEIEQSTWVDEDDLGFEQDETDFSRPGL